MKILLIDGNNLGWRSFGQAPLTYDGKRVEMIFIGLNMLRKYIADFEPDDCCIVWDGGHDSRRKKLFPQYKKKKKRELTKVEEREKDTFFWQLKEFQKVLNSFEIPQIRCKGREADDVIHNIICDTKLDSVEFILISTDKDFYQLLNRPENVRIYSPGKKKEITIKDIEKEFGIPIEHYIEYKAMVGDPSDNLPGITGIGRVAAKWLVNNIIVKNYNKEVTKSNMRIIDLLYNNIEVFKLMKDLITFIAIDSKEIEAGKFGTRTHAMAGYQERILWVLEKYGFDRFLKKFEWFFSPFEILWRKNEKSNFRRSS